MTFLLMQTFLLLAAAYFLGALLACTIKRIVAPVDRREPTLVHAREAPVPVGYAPPAPVQARPQRPLPLEPVEPRYIEPIQPRIDIVHRPVRAPHPLIETGVRPDPRVITVSIDPSRFERALFGPDPNEGVPRVAICELRPACIDLPTGPALPWPPEPKLPPEPEPEPEREPETTVFDDAGGPSAIETPDEDAGEDAPRTQPSAGRSARMGAAAAALSAARSAVANAATSMLSRRAKRADTPDAAPADDTADDRSSDQGNDTGAERDVRDRRPATPSDAPPEPAAPRARLPGDDLQRIRAIDAETEQRLLTLGVSTFDDIAAWTSSDVSRISRQLGLNDRIDREQWIEQAQILAKGGETYYSRNRASALRMRAQDPAPIAAPAPEPPAAVDEPEDPAYQPPALSIEDEPDGGAEPKKFEPEQFENKAHSEADSYDQPEFVSEVVEPEPVAPAEPEPPTASEPEASPDAGEQPAGTFAASAAAAAAAMAYPASAATPPPPPPQSRRPPLESRDVSEMAHAAAAAIAAASASVTRGIRPIEPLSPLSKVDPNIAIPARITDAIRAREAQGAGARQAAPPTESTAYGQTEIDADADDLKRIRGIGVLIEKRLNALGFTRYEHVANWSSADIDRVSQILDFKGRIERENWVEQARILASGGQTEFSRRVDRGDVDTSRDH